MLDYSKNWTIYHQEIMFKPNLEILGYSLVLYPHAICMFEKNIFDENIQIKHPPFFFFLEFFFEAVMSEF